MYPRRVPYIVLIPIDLPDGLLLEPVLGLLLSPFCCRRQLFYGCEPLPVTSGTVVNACKAGGQLFIWLDRCIQAARLASNMRKPQAQEAVQLCCDVLLRNKQQEDGQARKKLHVFDRRCWPIRNMHFFNYLASL